MAGEAHGWRPRSSKVAGYMRCLWRACYDRSAWEERQAQGLPEPERQSSTYADFGTAAHYMLQDAVRCLFPEFGDDPRAPGHQHVAFVPTPEKPTLVPADYGPRPEVWQNAAGMFGGSVDLAQAKARELVEIAAAAMPPLPQDARYWAETAHDLPWATGHIDFWYCSDDPDWPRRVWNPREPRRRGFIWNPETGTYEMVLDPHGVFGDLKTASRQPPGGKAKWEHLVQMALYHGFTGAGRSWLLYADSAGQDWTNFVWVDWTTPDMQAFARHVLDCCLFLCSDTLWQAAYPSPGEHCSSLYCDHRGVCSDRWMPGAGLVRSKTAAAHHGRRVSAFGGRR